MDILILALISFFTSALAGIVGLGGGLMLIAVLPSFLPLNAIIPIHGLSQISSNLSRAFLARKSIQYKTIPRFLIGSLFGVVLFACLISFISLEYVPLFIGLYILLSLWSQNFNDRIKKYENYYLVGFLQSGLSVVVGTTGPLTMTLLYKDFKDKEKVVATSAALMSITHLLKILVFIYFGFVFFDYIELIICMILGAILGSFIGTKLRHKIDGKKFVLLLKLILSVLAIKLIISLFI